MGKMSKQTILADIQRVIDECDRAYGPLAISKIAEIQNNGDAPPIILPDMENLIKNRGRKAALVELKQWAETQIQE
jgi:hypothetical protein